MLLKKIVIAEDDDAIAHMVNMALGDAGFLCLRARTGTEALRLVRSHVPDLLVLDVMMPEVDGLEVARRLRSDVILSKTPILMLTALGTVDNKIEGLEAGADDYLVKPFDLRELAARVKALIRASRREGDRNPTTLLPGSGSVELKIESLLSADEPCAVLHVDVSGFDEWADHVGYARAEKVVAELGTIVLDQVKAENPEEPFVGHLGGTDFIAVATVDGAEALAAKVVARFGERLEAWSRDTGSATDDNQLAATAARAMLMTIAIAPSTGLKADGSEALAARMASAMRAAKELGSSAYVVWKPEAS